jgi:hypothetical protein
MLRAFSKNQDRYTKLDVLHAVEFFTKLVLWRHTFCEKKVYNRTLFW